ncbi:serine/threonine-protein kinase [Arthrobacter sp. H41]|uniref:serine/threonine-protein kinase n=1 Tax=Arthrobacter sp. H41 TaxID=1312978 RepID=UPI0004796E27|nr:serine/threonine-protein kinase [Arthrobacter sp. H41]
MSVQTLAGGRYDLRERVGSGGMAEVFVARDTRLERDVAVKVFRPGTADGLERGSAEARLLAGLDHPGLVRVLDMDTGHSAGDSAYLVMEYVAGPDLSRQLRNGALDREEVRHLALDLARTLSYIHGRGVMHRDLKPSNILTRDVELDSGLFTYLLTDFGIARFFDGGRMTATNQVIGSAAYFSPEQARGDDVSFPTDIYSLGLVLIEALSGKRAFPGTGVESALARLHRSPSIPRSAGTELLHLLAAMTLDDPADRPTARAVVAALSGNGGTRDPAGASQPPAAVDDPAGEHAAAAHTAPAQIVDDDAVHDVAHAVGDTAVVATSGTTPVPRRAEEATEAFPSSADAAPSGAVSASSTPRRRWRLGVVAAIVVLVSLVVLAGLLLAGLISGSGFGSAPDPLPEVPGITGEKLEELYESVQP